MKETKEPRGLDHYLQLDYPITVYRAEEGGYVVEIEDLPGCITEGEDLEEAVHRIEVARAAWIETAYEDGIDIPPPRTDEQYSGRFLVRMPRYLHRRLAEQATREGVSLNQYVESILSHGAATKGVVDEITAVLAEKMRGASPAIRSRPTHASGQATYSLGDEYAGPRHRLQEKERALAA